MNYNEHGIEDINTKMVYPYLLTNHKKSALQGLSKIREEFLIYRFKKERPKATRTALAGIELSAARKSDIFNSYTTC
ncbi:hypothetical protein HMPREF9998_01164 [Peptostreptococcus anaerobius VPI 4330 = DSM 2949]|nr:hypothetical protein HMPREF9998_01164 [Peptostreptococcus anaerobius VPI 4330 = DSM 2949]